MSVKDRMMNAISLKCEATKHLIESEVPEAELIAEIIAQQKILVLLPHADESNIERWEKSLNVKAVSVDLEERRRYLLTLISSKLKVNTDTLAELSQRFTGVQALVTVGGSTVKVQFLGQLPQVSLNRFTNYIKALIPAHLGVNLSVSAPMSQEVYLYAFTGISVSALKFE
ncbi:YmfQ family protein [Aerococcaceae bacterium NML191219]|nr:YmfQ family protein [Aerococcaceae bacterium NML191219]